MLYKNRLVSLFLVSFGLIVAQPVTVLPVSQTLFIGKKGVTVNILKKRFKSAKPAVYVDFHDVVGLKDINKGWKSFKKNTLTTKKDKAKFVGRVAKTIVNPVAMAKMIKLGLKKQGIAESYFNVIKNHSSKKLHKQLIQFSADIYEPNIQMIELLYKLKAAGCRVYLFSNGGHATMQAIKNDPRFCPLFEGPDPLFSENAINTTYQDVYTVAKPSPTAFETALQKYNENSEYAIFIDNSRNKLCDWRNKEIQKKNPKFNNFWACSLLYHIDNHETIEEILHKLAIL